MATREYNLAHREERNAKQKAYYWNHRDERLAYGRRHAIKRRYGITLEEFDQSLADQGGVCAICEMKFAEVPHVDHDHTRQRARGLLCRRCNVMVGFLEHPLREAGDEYISRWDTALGKD
jgi:hypothetical protein